MLRGYAQPELPLTPTPCNAETEHERSVWASALGAAYSVHRLHSGYDDAKAKYYASNVAFWAVGEFRRSQPKPDGNEGTERR